MKTRLPLALARLLVVLPLLSLDWPVAHADSTPLPAARVARPVDNVDLDINDLVKGGEHVAVHFTLAVDRSAPSRVTTRVGPFYQIEIRRSGDADAQVFAFEIQRVAAASSGLPELRISAAGALAGQSHLIAAIARPDGTRTDIAAAVH